jgi:hypothetical protein
MNCPKHYLQQVAALDFSVPCCSCPHGCGQVEAFGVRQLRAGALPDQEYGHVFGCPSRAAIISGVKLPGRRRDGVDVGHVDPAAAGMSIVAAGGRVVQRRPAFLVDGRRA